MVDYRTEGPVAFLEINNPPVNAISSAVRRGLVDGIHRAGSDPRVTCIIMYGRGRTFPAGADIREFAGMRDGQGVQSLAEVCDHIEASRKPVIAALHGTILGGGLELSLASHYRIALKSSRIGFPEVLIGILPGAGGTQRLPRVAGLKVALDLIPSGRHMPATEAVKHGILDKLVDKDILHEGIKFAKSVAGKPFSDHISSQKPIKDAAQAQQIIEAATRKAKIKSKGMIAPIMNIKAVEAAVKLPFVEGLKREAELFYVLFTSNQAAALQYAFFAERAATKWVLPGGASHKTVKPETIRSIGIIGAGTMGSGIAMSVLNAGIHVILVEQNQQFLDKGVKAIHALYSGSVALKKMTPEVMKQRLAMLKPSVSYDDLAKVDLVIEAVFENLALKKEIFARLDQICKPSALLCSNTSALSIDKIAAATKRPDKVIGTHFFAPAYYMRLLENVRGVNTSTQTIATVTQFGNRIGKIPVLVGNCPGFVGNRMMANYTIESQFLIEEGSTPQEVDQVLEDFGMAMGPFKVRDLSGLDIGYRGRREVAKTLGIKIDSNTRFMNGQKVSVIAEKLVEAGRLGRKTGKGFYRYDQPGGKVAYPDQEVLDVILNFSKQAGIERRRIPPQEILERTLYGLINEGFKILETGIATKPEDIDTIWLYGYSWPRQTGGPMYYAYQTGLKYVYDRICHYQKLHPTSPHWMPSPLLKKLSMNNVHIREWTKVIADSRL